MIGSKVLKPPGSLRMAKRHRISRNRPWPRFLIRATTLRSSAVLVVLPVRPSSKSTMRVHRPSFPLAHITSLSVAGFFAAQFGLDEEIDVPIHHRLHIAGFGAAAMVFYHLVRLKNI